MKIYLDYTLNIPRIYFKYSTNSQHIKKYPFILGASENIQGMASLGGIHAIEVNA